MRSEEAAALDSGMEVVPETDMMMVLTSVCERLENIERSLTTLERRLEGIVELREDMMPVANEVFQVASAKLSAMEEDGTIDFVREGLQVLRNVSTSFTPDDVRLLGQNVVSILLTVRNLTQPEVLDVADRAAHALVEPVPSKRPGLLKGLRDPEVKRGMALLLSVLRELGQDTTKNENGQGTPASVQQTR
jgi:uncharacterized protein YjgD (DUF1641 family)